MRLTSRHQVFYGCFRHLLSPSLADNLSLYMHQMLPRLWSCQGVSPRDSERESQLSSVKRSTTWMRGAFPGGWWSSSCRTQKVWAVKLWAAKAQGKVSKEILGRCPWCNTATALPPGLICSLAVIVLLQEAGTMRTHPHHGKTPVTWSIISFPISCPA